ncbi:MAG: adenylosuccinate lyase [Candidatus Aminicenantes bacterium]|nr:adenylosuccinate lyase [Candidatus Aminicenantes bacterium]
MIDRYSRPEMKAVWSEDNRYRKWLEVELSVCRAWAKLGRIPASALKTIENKASFDAGRIEEIERTVKHDVIAFLTNVAERVGPDARHIHLGLTSYDVVDTAFSLLIKDALLLVKGGAERLRAAVREQAVRHKRTIMVGRTHGVHAEPITLGVKLLVWHEEIGRHLGRLDRALDAIGVGRISGSVGTFIHLDPRVEELALAELGLRPAAVSTQILQRDRHAEVLAALALLASSLDKFAVEVRHHQRTEVLEIEEPFTPGQKGSSSMPHKKNPVRAERISGLARIVRSNLLAALENIGLWHERDISHSSAERVIFPDSFLLADFLLAEAEDIIRHWKVDAGRMAENLQATRGLIFSQALLLALTSKGLSREDAYGLVQRLSLGVWEGRSDLREAALADPDVGRSLSPAEVKACFSLDPYLEKIDLLFERVLGHES